MSIDDRQQDSPPVWVVRFVVNGNPVDGRIPDWPTSDAPEPGDSARVAFDPTAPGVRVTPENALIDYTRQATAHRSRGTRARFVDFLQTFAGFVMVLLGVGAVLLVVDKRLSHRAPRGQGQA